MSRRPLVIVCLAALVGSCTGSSATKEAPLDGGAPQSAEPTLSEESFARPWVFIDGLSPDLPFDALIRIPTGFVAVTHAPSMGDAKANPARNNVGAFSPDGIHWEQQPLGESVHARSLAAGNGVVVAVGQRWGTGPRGSILTSLDGRTWKEGPAPDVGLMAVKFVNGLFWAFGERGAFFTSPDGVVWGDQSRPASVQLNDIAFGNGRYVVVGNVSWLSSTDGGTWNEQRSICDQPARCPGVLPPGGTAPGALALFSVTFGNGAFVTSGGVGSWTSSDGLTWTEAPGAVGGSIFAHGRFLARDDGRSAVVTSDEGQRWRTRTTFVVSDRNALSCQDHTCLVFPNGFLLIPAPADAAAIPRSPELDLDGSRSGQKVTVNPTQKIVLNLQTIGPGQYGTPELSSPAVRFVRAWFSPLPNPGGPIQFFELRADSAGTAELRIPHTEARPPFTLTIEVAD
jgi:hypothetical protein